MMIYNRGKSKENLKKTSRSFRKQKKTR